MMNNKENRRKSSIKYYYNNKEEIAKKNKKRKDNYTEEQKEKRRENDRKRYFKHRNERLDKNKRYYIANSKTIHSRYFQAKSQAKRRKKDFFISEEEYIVIITKECFYCNGFFKNPLGEKGGGLDRIDNSKGYTVDNVQSCCKFCNYLRGDRLTIEETKIAVKAIISFHKNKNQNIEYEI